MKTDPFQVWRDEQRPTTSTDQSATLELSAGRNAIRMLKIIEFVDAVWDHNEPEINRLGEELVELNHRLFAEQAAEHGHLPETIEGATAILDVAAQIIEHLAEATA